VREFDHVTCFLPDHLQAGCWYVKDGDIAVGNLNFKEKMNRVQEFGCLIAARYGII
jgi:hypothetical protein